MPATKTFEMKLFERSRTFGKLVKLLQQLPVSLAFDVTKSFELYVSCLKSRITKLPLSLSTKEELISRLNPIQRKTSDSLTFVNEHRPAIACLSETF